MLTATAEMAVKALVFLVLEGRREEGPARPASPREIAEGIGASPTYLAKTLNLLVKAGILRSQRGALGGVVVARAPEEISLLEIVQACQGLITADYCEQLGRGTSAEVCAFHQAMYEVHEATLAAFGRWNLAMLADKPAPSGTIAGNPACRMGSVAKACGACPSGKTTPPGTPAALRRPRKERV